VKNPLIILSIALLSFTGTSHLLADPIVFNFSPSQAAAGNVGLSEDYTSGGFTITAYGFVKSSGAQTSLYQKYTPGDTAETGLGLNADSDHEIPGPYFVQLDVKNLIDAGFSSLTLSLGSLQRGEQANIYADTSFGSFSSGSSFLVGLVGLPEEISTTVALTTRYLNITGGGSNGADPVLQSATASVPDGGSTALLLGASMLGFAAFRRVRPSAGRHQN
jgi:hypothetical protein